MVNRIRKLHRVRPVNMRRTVGDALENLMSGMGGGGDKSLYTRFGSYHMDMGQAELAYRGDWISRKIVDIPAQDATREWRSWQADNADIQAIEDTEHTFNLQRKLMLALQKGRLYGGGCLVLGINQGKTDEPVILDKLGRDSLVFVHACSRKEITAGPLNTDIMSPFYGEPSYYERSGPKGLVRFHPSRVVRLLGAEYPDPFAADGWSDSVLQVVRDAVLAAGSVSQAIAHLVNEAKLDVIRIPDLTANVSDDDFQARLKERFGLASDAKSIFNMLILDKEEEWDRIEMNFSTLPDIIKVYLLMASGAADIPATRLLGQAPQGMNSTGDSDTRNYYDRCATEQSTVIGPALERLDEVLVRSALGSRPEEIFYLWNPLWQMDEAQKAEVDNKKANTFKIDVDAGVIDGAVLKEARQNQLIEDGVYPGIETAIDELGQEYEEPAPMLVAPGVDPKTGQPMKALPPPDGEKPVADMANRIRAFDARRMKSIPRIRSVKPKRGSGQARIYKLGDRRAIKDAQPRTLYVRRQLLNWEDVAKHYKKQGLKTTVGEAMHVTIAYSQTPVDWMKAGEAWGQDEKGNLTILPGGPRTMETFNQRAYVLLFASNELSWRWCSIKDRCDADWKWPDYQPHVTITYEGPTSTDLQKEIEPWQGKLVFGPEVFEEVDPEYGDLIIEDALAKKVKAARKRAS